MIGVYEGKNHRRLVAITPDEDITVSHGDDVYREFPADISDDDARAEGYPAAKEYLEAFCRINRLPAVPDQTVFVVKFEVVA